MVIVVQRSDLSRMFSDLEADKVRIHHFGLSVDVTQRAELIVFMDSRRVYVLEANDWPRNRRMSTTQLLQYIAKQTA